MKLMVDARYTRIGFHDGISRYTASLLGALKTLIDTGDEAAADLDLSVPADLSILGFGNQDHRSAEALGLTTVDWPLTDMTSAAVTSIINVIEGRPPTASLLPASLAVTEEATPASSQTIPVATIPTRPVWRASVARRR